MTRNQSKNTIRFCVVNIILARLSFLQKFKAFHAIAATLDLIDGPRNALGGKTFASPSYLDSVVLWRDFTPFGSSFASASAANCSHVWSARLPVHIFCESVCNAG